ncbi:fatty acid desaturase 4, chloroplastic-like [Actinidia eriantha]|uniref:fatty acid desaturase 4, chloroplastic-like n=1 Tax=Actinidia eriantha TaxID=165200 RepID=UPI002584AD7F|nr:fatty acid desaturase 4, chloroplastic-like [Actinidia eriantha]
MSTSYSYFWSPFASMTILSQHHYHPLRSSRHADSDHQRRCPMNVHCSTTTTTIKPKPEQLVIEQPRLVTPPPSVTATTHVTLNYPSLQSTWSHRAWVASGCTTLAVSLVKCVTAAAESHMWFEPILAGLVGYVLADLGSGLYHWGIDNYGSASTPVFGSQIEGFQGHHKWPWTITRRQFANNIHALARGITFTVLPIDLICNGPILHGFVAVCSGCIMFSQQFHAWAHGTKSRLPPLVLALQDAGVLVSRSQHAAHHRQPYNNNYCIVSGVWNEFLDELKVFEALEMIVFFKLGVRPRSWSEPNSEWTEENETPSQTTLH